MRRSSSQPSLALKAVSERGSLEDYADTVLSRHYSGAADTTTRARELDQILRKRRSSIHSFSESRPLSSAEAEAFTLEEARVRREARLVQVREKERVNAALRRLEYDATRKAAARQVATALDKDYETGFLKFHNSETKTPHRTPAMFIEVEGSELESDAEERFFSNRSGRRHHENEGHAYRRVAPGLNSNSTSRVDPQPFRSNVFQRPFLDAMRSPDGEAHRPPVASQRLRHPQDRVPSKPEISRKLSDEDFLRPDSTLESERAKLWKLYDDFSDYQVRWGRIRDHVNNQNHRIGARAAQRPVRQTRLESRYDDKWHFLNERDEPATEYKEEEKREDPGHFAPPRRLQGPIQQRRRSTDHSAAPQEPMMDLAPEDLIVLKDDGFYLESGEENDFSDRLASTTWFALAEDDLSSEEPYATDFKESSSPRQRITPVHTANRLHFREPNSERVLDEGYSPVPRRPSTSSMQKQQPFTQPPPDKVSLIDRLRRGERVPVTRNEMLSRTEKAYSRLPEISEQRKELLRREDAERRRRAVLELDQRRRIALTKGSASSSKTSRNFW